MAVLSGERLKRVGWRSDEQFTQELIQENQGDYFE